MTGIRSIAKKEFYDFISSKRFWSVFGLMILLTLVSIQQGLEEYHTALEDYEASLTDTSDEPTMRFVSFSKPSIADIFSGGTFESTGFLVYLTAVGSLLAIAVGYDAVSRERKDKTMHVLLTYPLYKDQVINGKFLGRLAALSITVVFTFSMVVGFFVTLEGMPSVEEFLRIGLFGAATIVYLSLFLGMSILFSILLEDPDTSLLSSMTVWIASFLLIGQMAIAVANVVAPEPSEYERSQIMSGIMRSREGPEEGGFEPTAEMIEMQQTMMNNRLIQSSISKISPMENFEEVAGYLLDPDYGVFQAAVSGGGGRMRVFVSGTGETSAEPRSISESLQAALPSLAFLIVPTLLFFVAAYIKFMRQDI